MAGGYVLGWEDALLTEIGATIGFTSRRTARRINRLKGIVARHPSSLRYFAYPDFLDASRFLCGAVTWLGFVREAIPE